MAKWTRFAFFILALITLPAPAFAQGPAPLIYSLGSGCDNWDCVWISGADFASDSRVEIVSADGSAGETRYGPAWQLSPTVDIAPEGDFLSFQITDPVLLNWFGGIDKSGIYARVVNSDGSASAWAWAQAPAPVITGGGLSCADLRCVWLAGMFPLNAWVDFRLPDQSDVLPGAYANLQVEPELMTLRLNPEVWPQFDVSGFRAWAVTGLFPNWSSDYYVAPAPRQTPVIYSQGSGCDNWDCVWIYGAAFAEDSRVEIVAGDWSVSQTLYGPAWQMSPAIWVSPEGNVVTFQITDAALRNWFGGFDRWGIYARVINGNATSPWVLIQAPAPVITGGGPECDDYRCVRLTGGFPLNAHVDFRLPDQPDILPEAYTDLHVEPTVITVRLNPSVWPPFDFYGLRAWAVNNLFPNWSGDVTIAPVSHSVLGIIDGVSATGVIGGWACALHDPGSIAVHVYVGGPAGGGGTMILAATADASSEPAVAEECQSTGTAYRYSIELPPGVTGSYAGQSIHVYGISPFTWLPNAALYRSGFFTVPYVDRSIIGNVESVTQQGPDYYLNGWACARTASSSIDVHVYAGGPAGGGGTFLFAGTANLASEPAVSIACNSEGSNHRFSLQIPLSVRQQFEGQVIYAHGISPFGLENSWLPGSGIWLVPAPPALSLSSKEYIYLGGRLIAVETNP
ncbi:MAG TPA: hypothetical protein VFY29_17005 [Terriglobia bacterium]|nr:hypothetical protein [Terriglobia bacterium]